MQNRDNILEHDMNSRIREIYDKGLGSFPSKAFILLKQTQADLIALLLAYKQQWIATALLAQQWQAQQLAGPYQNKWRFMQTWAIQLGQPHYEHR